jgi:hypothetical protein
MNNLKESNIEFKSSFYGGVHLSNAEMENNGYWIDDAAKNYSIPLWSQWRDNDPVLGNSKQQLNDCMGNAGTGSFQEDALRQKYPYPFDLIPKNGNKVFEISIMQGDACDTQELVEDAFRQGFFNARMVEFSLENYCSHADLDILWTNIAPAEKENFVKQCQVKFAKLDETIAELKKQGITSVCNLNILSFWKSAPSFREQFFAGNPDADPKFYGFAAEDAVSSTICPASPVYMELVKSIAREIVECLPSLDFIQLTIDDNGGYIRCENPEHDHPEFSSLSEVQIKKSVELINAFYFAARETRDVKILCRCWCATYWFAEEAIWQKYYSQLPERDFIISGKINAPPVVDWSPQSPLLNPGVKLWNEGCFYCYWGETSGMKNNFPLHYLYVNPQQVLKDMKQLADSGKTRVIISQADNMITSELDSLTLRACSWNPEFDLESLKQSWAGLRFGEAADDMLNALSMTPDLLKTMTLYHDGYNSAGSLHLAVWGGIRNAESFFFVPAPKWLAEVTGDNENDILERINPVPVAEKIIDSIKSAVAKCPDNELIRLYLDQAEMSLSLAIFYRNYHYAFMKYRLWYQDVKSASGHLKQARALILEAQNAIDDYSKNQSQNWKSMTRRRYLAFNCDYCCKILTRFLEALTE